MSADRFASVRVGVGEDAVGTPDTPPHPPTSRTPCLTVGSGYRSHSVLLLFLIAASRGGAGGSEMVTETTAQVRQWSSSYWRGGGARIENIVLARCIHLLDSAILVWLLFNIETSQNKHLED